MANFFSADYWKALYFKAVGGQETAVDPNAMRGTFAGVASFAGTLDEPAGAISGTFVGSASFTGDLTFTGTAEQEFHGPRRTLGWIRDATYSLLRGKRRKDEEELVEEVAAKLAPKLPEPVDYEALERSIEQRAKEIADRLAAIAPADAVSNVTTDAAFGRGSQAFNEAEAIGLDAARLAAAIEQAATALAEDRRRKLDEEEALILLLLAA